MAAIIGMKTLTEGMSLPKKTHKYERLEAFSKKFLSLFSSKFKYFVIFNLRASFLKKNI